MNRSTSLKPARQAVALLLALMLLPWCTTALGEKAALAGQSAKVVTLMAADNRPVDVRVVAPANHCQPCDAIVFSHGANLSFDQYEVLFSAWVDAGYVVLAPLHVDSESHPKRDQYDQSQVLALRIEDYQRVVSALLEAPNPLLSDSTFLPRYMAAGHSYGALIAQIAAGARLDQLAVHQKTVMPPLGVIALSPPGPIEGFLSSSAWQSVSQPQLVITGTEDVVAFVAPKWQDHLASFYAGPADKSYALVFAGMDHYFNGSFGRLSFGRLGESTEASLSAIKNLNQRIVYFADALVKQQPISAEQWQALASPDIDALFR